MKNLKIINKKLYEIEEANIDLDREIAILKEEIDVRKEKLQIPKDYKQALIEPIQ